MIKLRDEAIETGRLLSMQKESKELNKVICDLVGEIPLPKKNKYSQFNKLVELVDPVVIKGLEGFYEELLKRNYVRPLSWGRRKNPETDFNFFESFFTNRFEGINFSIDEARSIIINKTPIPKREINSDDLLRTYELIKRENGMIEPASSADMFLDLLKKYHKYLVNHKIDRHAGQFRDLKNITEKASFVEWQYIPGALKKGFELYEQLDNPFSRAVYLMFMISIIQPFNDRNEVIADIMMNAELVRSGLPKILIAVVDRRSYIAFLYKGFAGAPADYIHLMTVAWRLSSYINRDDSASFEEFLLVCGSFNPI